MPNVLLSVVHDQYSIIESAILMYLHCEACIAAWVLSAKFCHMRVLPSCVRLNCDLHRRRARGDTINHVTSLV